MLLVHQLKNCCDIIISKYGKTACIEIKDGLKPNSQQKLTPGEEKFKFEWQGMYFIVTSCYDAEVVTACFQCIEEYKNKELKEI